MMPTPVARHRTTTHSALRNRVWTAVVLACGLVTFLSADRWFSILDDETIIVTKARKPVIDTIRLFWDGHGEHEHPPLSDLLLHFWLPIGGAAQWSLRLPSVFFYLIGLLFLAMTANQLAGPAAF